MRSHTPSARSAAAVAVAVLAAALILLAAAGLTEALMLIALVALLSGMYALRHYARARLIYQRRSDSPGRETT